VAICCINSGNGRKTKKKFLRFIYLSERERAHKQGGGAEGEAGSPPSKEPDPRTPEPRPEPQADAQPTEPPRSSEK